MNIVVKKSKIEVIKATFDEELAKEYGVTCVCPAREVGNVFALCHIDDDALLYGDWIQTTGVSINSCNDGIRAVIFKIIRINEESDNLYMSDGIPTGVKN